MSAPHPVLVVCGLGYCGEAVARAALGTGFAVIGTHRDPTTAAPLPGVAVLPFAAAGPAIARATHLLITAAPEPAGDPVLAAHAGAIAAAPALRWIGYLSTPGVYGDRGGDWVDEDTQPAPAPGRSRHRLEAEQAWRAAASGRALDLFRVAGIYGPGRSALDDVRAGRARRVIKPGHLFGRIHRDDIAAAVLAAMRQDRTPDPHGDARVLNLADDEPAENAEVIAYAARLLGADPPPAIPFAQAAAAMSEMGLSFWRENRKVASRKTQAELGITWRYRSYREGLAAILAEERGEHIAQ